MTLKNISVRKMRVFLSVVENKSFTKAATEQNISQPAATIIVNQIEASAGVDLFERRGQTRRTILTDRGRRVSEVFSRIVGQFDDEINEIASLDKAHNDPTIILIQDCFADALNPLWLNQLLILTAKNNFQVEIEKRDRIVQRVTERSARIGLIDGQVDNNINDFWPIADYTMSLLVPKRNHFIRNDEGPIGWDNIPDACCILGGLANQTARQVRRRLSERSCGGQGLYEVSSPRTLGGIMSQNGLPAIVPSVIAPTICDQTHCDIVPLVSEVATSSVGLITRIGDRSKDVRSKLESISPFYMGEVSDGVDVRCP